jgi:hypothetical protein
VIWIAYILLGLAALVVTVLALPFHARAEGALSDGELSGSAAILWAFGALGIEVLRGGFALRVAGLPVLRLAGRADGRPRPRKRDCDRPAEERRPRPGLLGRIRAVLANSPRLIRMAARLARALHLRLRVRGRVGTGDPADTAAVAGLLRAARALPGIEVEVELDWMDETLELAAEGSARLWAPELVAVAGVLLWERGNRAALRALRG